MSAQPIGVSQTKVDKLLECSVLCDAAQFDRDRDSLLCDLNAEVAALRAEVERLRTTCSSKLADGKSVGSSDVTLRLGQMLAYEEQHGRAFIESCAFDALDTLRIMRRACDQAYAMVTSAALRSSSVSCTGDTNAHTGVDAASSALLSAYDYTCAREVYALYAEAMHAYGMLLCTHASQTTMRCTQAVATAKSDGFSISHRDDLVAPTSAASDGMLEKSSLSADGDTQRTSACDANKRKPLPTMTSVQQLEDSDATHAIVTQAVSCSASDEAAVQDANDGDVREQAEGAATAEDALLMELRQSIELDESVAISEHAAPSSALPRNDGSSHASADDEGGAADKTDVSATSDAARAAQLAVTVRGAKSKSDDDGVQSTASDREAQQQATSRLSDIVSTASSLRCAATSGEGHLPAPDVSATASTRDARDSGTRSVSVTSHSADGGDAVDHDTAELNGGGNDDRDDGASESNDGAREPAASQSDTSSRTQSCVAANDSVVHSYVASSAASSVHASEEPHSGVAEAVTHTPPDAHATLISHTPLAAGVPAVASAKTAAAAAAALADAAAKNEISSLSKQYIPPLSYGLAENHVDDRRAAAAAVVVPAKVSAAEYEDEEDDDAIDVGFDPFA